MEEERRNQIRKKVGQQIADLRNQAGLTVEELAEKAGFSKGNINSIEHGKYNVNLNILGAVCDALNAEIILVKKESF